MADSFADVVKSIMAPATRMAAVTPHDTTEIDVTRGIIVGVAGNLVGKLADDSSSVTIYVQAGIVHPLRFKLITTSSTASSIVALY